MEGILRLIHKEWAIGLRLAKSLRTTEHFAFSGIPRTALDYGPRALVPIREDVAPCRHVELDRRSRSAGELASPAAARPRHLRSDDPGHRGRHLVLDPRCREGRDRPRLPPQLLPVPDHRVHPGDPPAGQRDQLADAGHRRRLRPERVRGVLRELRDPRRRRRVPPGRDRARVRPADVGADRRSAGDVPDPALPRWASAVAALAVVRLGPGHQHGDHLPGDPVRPGTVRGERVPERGEPARLRGAAAGAGGRHGLPSSCCRSA